MNEFFQRLQDALVKLLVTKKQSATFRRQLPKDGVTLILCDRLDKGEVLAQQVIESTYTEEERASALCLDHVFDAEVLDTWVRRRRLEPDATTFVVTSTLNPQMIAEPAFQDLIAQLDMINTAVVITCPFRHATTPLIRCADNVLLTMPLRKVQCAERGYLYRAIFGSRRTGSRSRVNYSRFIDTWIRFRRGKKLLMINDEIGDTCMSAW